MLLSLGMILLGFATLLFGGDALLKAAVNLSLRAKVSATVIALTVIATGTSLPELVTSLLAARKGANDIVTGNIIGSNIFNILAIIGLTGLLKPCPVHGGNIKRDILFLIGITFAFTGFGINGNYSRVEGLVFLLIFLAYMGFTVIEAKKKGIAVESEVPIEEPPNTHFSRDIFLLLIGFAGLIGGAHIALEGAITLGRLAGLSERIIGLTIVSIGTGLPELATSAIAAYRGRDDIAVANIVGSNIMNTFGIVGATALYHPINFSTLNFPSDTGWLNISTALLMFFILSKGKIISRRSSFIFLSLYIGYLGSLFL